MKRPGLTGLLGAVLLALWGGGAAAQTPAPEAIPRAWIAYAQRVSTHLQAALEGDSEPAQRFQAYFSRQVAAADEPTVPVTEGPLTGNSPRLDPPTLRVKVWLDLAGRVTRVDAGGLGDAQALTDLRTLLLQQSVGAAPPRAMRQPVVVRLSLSAQL